MIDLTAAIDVEAVDVEVVASDNVEVVNADSALSNLRAATAPTSPALMVARTAPTMSASMEDTCYLMQITLSASGGAVRIPKELCQSERISEVFAENGVKGSASIPVFSTAIAVGVIQQYVPGWKPKRHEDATAEIGTKWARNIIQTKIQYLRKRYFSPVSKELGWLFAEKDLTEISAEISLIQNLTASLIELLTSDAVYEAAKSDYANKIEAVITALCQERGLLSEADSYIEHLMKEFPFPHQIRNGFRVTTTPPQELPSLAAQMTGHAATASQLADQLDSENALALASLKEQGIDSLRSQVQGQAGKLQDELSEAVTDTIRRIRSGSHTETINEKIQEVSRRIETIDNMLSGLSGKTAYTDISKIALDLASLYTSDDNDEGSDVQISDEVNQQAIEGLVEDLLALAQSPDVEGAHLEMFNSLLVAQTDIDEGVEDGLDGVVLNAV